MDFSTFKANPSPNGPIEGEGSDEVGDFEFRGNFNGEGNKVRFEKRYIGKHSIYYEGDVTMEPASIEGSWGFEPGSHDGTFKIMYKYD